MSTGATPLLIAKKSQDAIIQYQRSCFSYMLTQYNYRERMRLIDLEYQREMDWTPDNVKARIANMYGDANKFQNITIPVVLPQIEASVMYQTSVFLTGEPIFGVVASPQYQNAALQMETVIDRNSNRSGGVWKREFMKNFRDGFKYNLAALEVKWDRRVTAELITDPEFTGGVQGRPKETIWQGNSIKSMDMYNTFFDTRVCPIDVAEYGEFAGYTELMGRVRLKQFINELPDKMVENVKAAFESGTGSPGGFNSSIDGDYYIPPVNPAALVDLTSGIGMNWEAWAGLTSSTGGIQYKNLYRVTTLYARILPSDFNLSVPARNTPQIWKFIIVNNQILIYAERQTNAHNLLPMLFTQPLEDNLSYQTKSLATNMSPLQAVSSALMNAVIHARRRAISDRVLYDPSLIAESVINSPNPSAKMPVRPSAYGTPLSNAVFPFPFRDDQSGTALSEIAQLGQLADQIAGHNPAMRGQFVKGNKTREEFNTIMGNGEGRDQMCSILLEAQLMTPLKHILKIDILQYQGAQSLYNRSEQKMIDIDPLALRKAVLEFKVSDGITPSSKLINSDTLTAAFQVMSSSATLNAGYNSTQLFSYLMKQKGADLRPFEKAPEQLAYEQALQAWQGGVAQMTEALKVAMPAAAEMPLAEIIKMLKESIPPQPTPDQFGYKPNPAAPPVDTLEQAILPPAPAPQQGA